MPNKILKKIKITNIKGFFSRLPRTLAENYFYTFLGLIFVAVIIGLLIFYQCTFSSELKQQETTSDVLKFDQETYQKVLAEWQKRNQDYLQADDKIYSNPF